MKAVEPIWTTKPETASRLRGRIESILDWAKVRGLRAGDNPARWRGHLDQLLPAPNKVRKVTAPRSAALSRNRRVHGRATRPRRRRRARSGICILTAARTNEVLGAKWDEIDGQVWTIPASRMKAGREHRVPLSDTAMAIIEQMKAVRGNDYVFPGDRRDMLSNMAMLMTLRRMGRGDLTTHGFRATFRTWAAERSQFPREVVESALAHVIGNKVEVAYQRGDLFDKRRRLMDAWAEYCAKAANMGASVIPLRK